MKLCKMIEIYFKYDNMHTNGIINAFIFINNHVSSCIKCMLSSYIWNKEENVFFINMLRLEVERGKNINIKYLNSEFFLSR